MNALQGFRRLVCVVGLLVSADSGCISIYSELGIHPFIVDGKVGVTICDQSVCESNPTVDELAVSKRIRGDDGLFEAAKLQASAHGALGKWSFVPEVNQIYFLVVSRPERKLGVCSLIVDDKGVLSYSKELEYIVEIFNRLAVD